MRVIAALLTATLLSGCITIYSETVVNHYPSKTQEKFPRGKIVFACYSTDAVMDYVENGSLKDCVSIEMTAARRRSEFYTSTGLKVVIYVFQRDGVEYFTVARN